MRKKWSGIGLSVGITGALIWGYGASASADSTTMGVYESALHQTKDAKSMTAHAQLALTDNGAKLLTLEGVAKLDHNQHIGNADNKRNEVYVNTWVISTKCLFCLP